MRLLSTVSHHPDDVTVLLTAPTGIAAHNLHAATIHRAFSIGKDVRLPYTPLGEEKVNSLRAKYSSLQILIIDEISMVDHKLLAYIHGRLQQIKQSGDSSPFGNVSVIAVGDFYQLPPVKGKPLCVDNIGCDLWANLFRIVELKTIVRQKDVVFAELLNRVRIHPKGVPMLEGDINILKQCVTGEVCSALHIFATNKQVNEHNMQQLFNMCPEYVTIVAQDFVNSKKTGKLELMKGQHSRTYNTCLEEVLLLRKDARVMLLKNIDVDDGLVNGVCGIVTDIVYPDTGKFPRMVYVKFDDPEVGAQRRKRCANTVVGDMGSTGIEPEEERVTNKGGMRRQFPVKLAWACTIHKRYKVLLWTKLLCPLIEYLHLGRRTWL
uniref:ATP-dependent DNA helicase n=1 Tax=Dicentrarchus labrax TaxID=13489 RepID=A0A8P4GKF1_DICLA